MKKTIPNFGTLIGQRYSSQSVKDSLAAVGSFKLLVDPYALEWENKDRIYYSAPAAGIEILVDAKTHRIDTIFLCTAGTESDFRRYDGPLPFGLNFSMIRVEVQAHMREPDVSRNVPTHYDAWEEGDYKLGIEYSETGSIKTIMFMGT